MLSRSHGLHGAWQRAGRGGSGEKNGPAKPCEGRSDPQTRRLEEETPTATSFPQGAHAVLEQGEFHAVRGGKTGIRFCLAKRTIKLVIKQSATHRERLLPSTDSCENLCVYFAAFSHQTNFLSNFLSSQSGVILERIWAKALPNILNHNCWLVRKLFHRGEGIWCCVLKYFVGRICSDVFNDKWETQTLTGTLETLLISTAARLNSNVWMLLLAVKKSACLNKSLDSSIPACMPLRYDRGCFLRLRHLFPHMGDGYT